MTQTGEAAELVKDILRLTSSIPPSIVNGKSSSSIARFKKDAAKARTVAETHGKNLSKLREAHALIRPYYNE